MRYDFEGYEPTETTKTGGATVYKTVVADAAKYYGVMRATSDIVAGDSTLSVDSIYTHLVPSAQSESPIADVTAGTVPTNFSAGDGVTFSINCPQYITANAVSYLPMVVEAGSLSYSVSGHNFHTEGTKVIHDSTNTEVGAIDHQAGIITYSPNIGTIVNGSVGTMTFKSALGGLRIGNSKAMPILLSNRGYNYVTSLVPLPDPGSVAVDYMAQGKWYRLADDGSGVLRGIAGSGSVNYETGAVIVTCGALPDANTALIYNWGNPIDYVSRGGKTLNNQFIIKHTVAEGSINPGSLALKWWNGASQVTATDDGLGNITGTNSSGTVIYSTGEIRFTPSVAPNNGSELSIDYDKFAKVTHVAPVTSGVNSITLPDVPIKPGTLSVHVGYVGYNCSGAVRLYDDGAGKIFCEPEYAEVSLNRPLNRDQWEGTTDITFMPTNGTIDYDTGEIYFNGDAEVWVKWIEKYTRTETIEVED